jgi:starch synthase
VDTVPEFSPDLQSGNGFIFHEYSPAALARVVRQAAEKFKNNFAWAQAAERVMNLDYSWQNSAAKYERVYKAVLDQKR